MKAGFSLVEMTVALAITLVVTGAVFALMDPAQGVFQAQPELMDLQQRLRVAVDGITREVIMAGAGNGGNFASVLPRRRGQRAADPPEAFFSDRISVLYVPAGAPETTVSAATDAGSAVYVAPKPGCPASDPLCGFEPDTLAVIFDETGAYDTFRIDTVENEPPALVRVGGALSKSYAPGATVARIISATYWLRSDVAAGTSELMKYDGYASDLSIADDVVGLAFEYYGVAATPSAPLVRLERASLTDGPWIPDASAPERFDADLLRVRSVRVTLRVRSSGVFLRAPLRDQQISFVVTPRNLSLIR